MDTFARIDEHLGVLRRLVGEASTMDAATRMTSLGDDEVLSVLKQTSLAIRELDALRVVAAGIAADRSARDAGHDGLAQRRGHRTPVSLVQEVIGGTRGDAVKAVRLGQTLTSANADRESVHTATDAGVPGWDLCLTDAFTRGLISLHQQSAIRTGLGEAPDGGVEAWANAAQRLIEEASRRTVEDLAAAARNIRDLLDPDGGRRRFDERYERRSFRLWKDSDGVRRGTFVFDDEGGAWVTAIIEAALRPRRGGPRFVDPAEAAAAEELVADPRTNDQLAYDLIIDVLRAGAVADATQVFGTRQAGVRIVVTDDALAARGAGVAVLEDTGATVPSAVAAASVCGVGSVTCTVDQVGNPLYLGRESRTFTPKQKVALSIRDGGCRWPGCDRPPAYCESHHIDPYAEGGRTDVDRGIQLCRYHHMNLHHHGWEISRERDGPFVLWPPGGRSIVLETRLERRYAWGDLRPPPARFRRAA